MTPPPNAIHPSSRLAARADTKGYAPAWLCPASQSMRKHTWTSSSACQIDSKQPGIVLTEDVYNEILLHMTGYTSLNKHERSELNKRVQGNRVYDWAKIYRVRDEGNGRLVLLGRPADRPCPRCVLACASARSGIYPEHILAKRVLVCATTCSGLHPSAYPHEHVLA